MKVNLSELSPWAEVSRHFANMKTLCINGHRGEVELTSEDGHVHISFKVKPKK